MLSLVDRNRFILRWCDKVITLLVSIAMTQGYFLGANIKIYIVMDIILAIMIAILWIWLKIQRIKEDRKKREKRRSKRI